MLVLLLVVMLVVLVVLVLVVLVLVLVMGSMSHIYHFKDVATNYADALTGIYEFIAKDYVEDVYRDIIETYIISTIKVLNFPTVQ